MKKMMRLFAMSTVLTCLLGAASAGPKEGEQYFRLKHPVTGVAARQVVEVFWYDCPDSYEFEKPLEDWAARQSPPVKVVRIPAAWTDQPDQLSYARLFYTLDKLGLAEREALPVFRAVRDQHKDLTTEENVLAWAAKEGLNVRSVRNAYRSGQVDAAVQAAPALRERYQVVEEPTVVVGGRFRTSPIQVGSAADTVAVMDHLYRTAARR
ncbi:MULTISPECIES: thiol:disulfide interchange protein DsbA/DsbL [unclassified Streptomyces]|uniref:thiol:disulfide interchange protein DsbA/DsbL n=1 Tax=unclassified Streptomyces TaxID=2593676 RepID=UPI00224FB2B7|nr:MULTISPECIES: thiol:disulfide interchange protein DsbA/DsbL [unclassified Streptomyces]MCX5051965.1 thiol:disulfide interchange protein DsbA/DsbL [Streptomyces sp. NBC_00474]MCX5062296.1 thiol:disulfide interchange protein DsbA/DsbL [Streptomyces sp. NBC_00452]MCX5249860.1 thiol:disulfide interchange protein DsbA/DsbL [Streptomyces sp. NBC_00201]MCX5292095.1 thiol:disulfide interchange protein DsbA/DsbL [Streptomyces sp. NBC_00183]